MEGRTKNELEGVTLLGNQNTKYNYDYNPDVLETFVNKHPDNDYVVTFDAYEFTSLCVTGDTLIDVATDETQTSNGVPIRDLVGKEGMVFSFDTNKEEPVAKKFKDVRCTGHNVPVVKVVMEIYHDIAEIICTPDHPILVETNWHKYEWICAKDLKPDMRLIPLNHKVVKVEDAGFADVYNMEVEDTENYFANGICVHNCPKTGQPDLAKVVINYIPNELMVESKSLKLYLFSFRNHGDFHEDCMNIIMKDLIKLMNPKYIEVKGIFAPRGGISIFPFVNWANPDFNYQDMAKQRQLMSLQDACNRNTRYDL